MLVECLERTDERTTVLQYYSHPEVDVLQHLIVFADRLVGEKKLN